MVSHCADWIYSFGWGAHKYSTSSPATTAGRPRLFLPVLCMSVQWSWRRQELTGKPYTTHSFLIKAPATTLCFWEWMLCVGLSQQDLFAGLPCLYFTHDFFQQIAFIPPPLQFVTNFSLCPFRWRPHSSHYPMLRHWFYGFPPSSSLTLKSSLYMWCKSPTSTSTPVPNPPRLVPLFCRFCSHQLLLPLLLDGAAPQVLTQWNGWWLRIRRWVSMNEIFII